MASFPRLLRAGASLTRFVGYQAASPARPFRQLWDTPVFTERTSVGLDLHARTVAAAAIDGAAGELFPARLTPAHDHITDWLRGLPGSVAVTYGVGPTGFGL